MNGSSSSTQSGSPRTQSGLACNICLRRTPNTPVAAYCGHVFCWPCLCRSWPQQGPGVQAGSAISKSGPVCGTALREGYNIVPIYGFDNVASPTSGTERSTTTGTTTPAAAAAPDNATSSRPTSAAAAPVSNTRSPPPRPTAAAFFTATPRRPYSVAARAAAAPNTAFPPRPAAVSSDPDIPPRPNPPARITQTDTVRAPPPVRPLEPNRLGRRHNLASSIPRRGTLGDLFFSGAGDRLRPASSAAGNSGFGVASRSIRRRRHLRLNPPLGLDGNGGNSWASHRRRMDVLHEILDDMRATLAEIAQLDVLRDALDELEDDLL